MKPTTSLATLSCALVLSACGGGGAGTSGPAAAVQTSTLSAIAPDNMAKAAGNGYRANALIGQSSSSLTGVVTGVAIAAPDVSVVSPVLGLVMRAFNRNGGALPAGVTVSQACSGGGTMTIDATLRDANTLSNGDTLSVTTSNCVENGITLNGALSVAVSGVSGDVVNSTSGSATLDARFTDFVVALGDVSDTVNGDMRIGLAATNASGYSLAISGSSLRTAERKSGVAVANRTLTDYALNGGIHNTTVTVAASFTVSGNSTGLGQFTYTVKNLQPFVFSGAGMPGSGSLIVNGAASSVTVTVDGANGVRLDYSAKGDGVVTQTSTLSWNDFLAAL